MLTASLIVIRFEAQLDKQETNQEGIGNDFLIAPTSPR
jgi:hypothetical protein